MDNSTLECIVCCEIYAGKIFLCETGHSLCENCVLVSKIKSCPQCKKPITTNRSYDLEKVIAELKINVKLSCEYKGCTYKFFAKDRDAHQTECKYRVHLCQRNYMGLSKCPWNGTFDNMLGHYKTVHQDVPVLPAVSKSILQPITFETLKAFYLIDFLDGKQLLYLKFVCNKQTERYHWLFQFVGPNSEAKNYVYEFEINKDSAKYKINGLCVSDALDANKLMEEENCVSLSFKQIRHYMNKEKEVNIQFRIHSKPKAKK